MEVFGGNACQPAKSYYLHYWLNLQCCLQFSVLYIPPSVRRGDPSKHPSTLDSVYCPRHFVKPGHASDCVKLHCTTLSLKQERNLRPTAIILYNRFYLLYFCYVIGRRDSLRLCKRCRWIISLHVYNNMKVVKLLHFNMLLLFIARG